MKFFNSGYLFFHLDVFLSIISLILENITQSHWIFAGVFTVCFLAYMIWSYRKDSEVHRLHYGGSIKILLSILVLLMVIYIFKRV
jgi:hypothetical protein